MDKLDDDGWARCWQNPRCLKVFDGVGWVSTAQDALSDALSGVRVERFDAIADFSDVSPELPEIASHRMLLGVTARVLDALVGATSWHLGTAANKTRFGNALPVARDTVVTGLANPPDVIWSPTRLTVTPNDGTLTSGRVALAIFTLVLPVPDMV